MERAPFLPLACEARGPRAASRIAPECETVLDGFARAPHILLPVEHLVAPTPLV